MTMQLIIALLTVALCILLMSLKTLSDNERFYKRRCIELEQLCLSLVNNGGGSIETKLKKRELEKEANIANSEYEKYMEKYKKFQKEKRDLDGMYLEEDGKENLSKNVKDAWRVKNETVYGLPIHEENPKKDE